MDTLEFLQNWFQSNCDGNWEHNFGVSIQTLDNPGWYIVIDLEDTSLENMDINESVEVSNTDWFRIQTKDMQLQLTGDSSKLVYLIHKIQTILSHHSGR